MVINVTLTYPEMVRGWTVAAQRRAASLAKGLKDKHGFKGNPYEIEISGALGECAVAKALGIYWAGEINNFKEPDLPHDIQVRHTSSTYPRLTIRPNDKADDNFVLVTGANTSFTVHGWLMGWEAMHDDFWDAPNNRPGAWFVPTSDLNPIDSLRGHIYT